jgi:hypothetical protein
MDLEESKRARKRVSNYCWKEQRLLFQRAARTQARGKDVPSESDARISGAFRGTEDIG